MQVSAKSGAHLALLTEMALGLLKRAACECPRTGPGRPPRFEDWTITALIVVAILNRRKTKSAQYHFLDEHRALLMRWLHLTAFPARSTYFARYHDAHHLLQQAVRLQGQVAILEGVADPSIVAVDKSVVAAKGSQWRRRHAKPIEPRPRGVDPDAGWNKSKHHGWVWGYSFETVVTAAEGAEVFPLLASVSSANCSEYKSFKDKIPQLPPATHHVLADAGYDSNAYQALIEYDAQDRPTGRHFLCPLIARGGTPRVGEYPHRGHRGLMCQRRSQRLEFLQSPLGQQLYERRSRTIEPFHSWFKNAFELADRVWHRGLHNNQTQILAAIFCYQLLLRYNYHRGVKNAQIQYILNRL